MLQGDVAPPAVAVRGAEVGGGHDDGARETPPVVVRALDLEAGAAASPAVEERRAQRRRVRAVSAAVEVAVPACSSYINRSFQ